MANHAFRRRTTGQCPTFQPRSFALPYAPSLKRELSLTGATPRLSSGKCRVINTPPTVTIHPKLLLLTGGGSTVIGVYQGATGVGGGILTIKMLTCLPGLGLTHLQAIANLSIACAPSGVSAAWVWLQDGFCDCAAAVCVSGCGFLGVIIGMNFARSSSDAALQLTFAAALCCVLAPLSLYRATKERNQDIEGIAPQAAIAKNYFSMKTVIDDFCCLVLEQPLVAVRHCVVGAVVGFFSGALAVGDTPLLIAYFAGFGATQKEAIGTATVAVVPTYILASLLHLRRGNAHMALAPVMMLTMSAGGALGAKYSILSLTDSELQIAFAVFVFLIGGQTCFAALSKMGKF